MLEFFKDWHIDAMFGALMLVYVGYAKWSALAFRKRAVKVQGSVLKVFPHSRFTSYFVSYHYEGTSRVAEYCGMPMVQKYQPGEAVDILIDGRAPPDVPVPATWHNAPGAHSGNCSLPGSSIVSLWDFVYVGASAYLIARSFGWKVGL